MENTVLARCLIEDCQISTMDSTILSKLQECSNEWYVDQSGTELNMFSLNAVDSNKKVNVASVVAAETLSSQMCLLV